MKLMIASDIHGSSYYCKEMIKAFKAEKAERLLLLGDILYHGPRNDLPKDYNPKQVISMLNEISDNIICVRGNCDTEVDQMVLDFPVMSDYALLYADGYTLYATHGHIYNQDNPLPFKKGDILLNGHTHVPKYVLHENYTYINPGSVSIPKEDSPHSYMIYENGIFLWKNLDGETYLSLNSLK